MGNKKELKKYITLKINSYKRINIDFIPVRNILDILEYILSEL